MKKVISICIILTICLTSICISGCSDFAFNPIGRWSFVEDIYYSNDKPYSKVTSEDDPAMKNFAVVFEKSGTGYIDSGTKTPIRFTYEYNEKEITMTITDRRNQNNGSDISTNTELKYIVSDDKQTIKSVTKNEKRKDEKGNEVDFHEERIFKR